MRNSVRKNRIRMLLGAALSLLLFAEGPGMSAQAAGRIAGGVASVLDPDETSAAQVIETTMQELNIVYEEIPEEETSTLVMADVQNALNVRSEADENAEKVGMLYKDCGGTILERADGWTKIQSGNLVGWCNDEYLLFDDEAEEAAAEVGRTLAKVNTTTLRVRSEESTSASILGLLPIGEIVEVITEEKKDEKSDHADAQADAQEDGTEWVRIDYEGQDGYIAAEFVEISFSVDAGETMEEIKAREEAEAAARAARSQTHSDGKERVNYGAFTADADQALLLAALIQCEAGGESYEGKVAVGAVVMNRVRSAAYPDTIHGVIYASGQFTPAMNGKVNRVYESGKYSQECIDAANEAIGGVSNVGDLTHFRRNNGRAGLVIGNHVFY